MVARLRVRYLEQIRPALKERFGYSGDLAVPRLEKIVLNMGVGKASVDGKKLAAAIADMAALSGQKPATTRARKSIAQFKLREGTPIGCKVTLRRARMYEFLDRLTNIALPRVRDFKGVPGKSFDGRGNCTIGLKEQLVFQEIDYDKIDGIRGLDVCIVTTARTDPEARALLEMLGVPFTG